uniref:Uncharacterized protein n=1 Tax=viral metagenome TaxID=1070528 RepID=A0A6H1ZIH1_9ZZZZ
MTSPQQQMSTLETSKQELFEQWLNEEYGWADAQKILNLSYKGSWNLPFTEKKTPSDNPYFAFWEQYVWPRQLQDTRQFLQRARAIAPEYIPSLKSQKGFYGENVIETLLPNVTEDGVWLTTPGKSYLERFEQDMLYPMLYEGWITPKQLNESLTSIQEAILNSNIDPTTLPFFQQLQLQDFGKQGGWKDYYFDSMKTARSQVTNQAVVSQALEGYQKSLQTMYQGQTSDEAYDPATSGLFTGTEGTTAEVRAKAAADAAYHSSILGGQSHEQATASHDTAWYREWDAINAEKQAEKSRVATIATHQENVKNFVKVGDRLIPREQYEQGLDQLWETERARARERTRMMEEAGRPTLQEIIISQFKSLMGQSRLATGGATGEDILKGTNVRSPAMAQYYAGGEGRRTLTEAASKYNLTARDYNEALTNWNWNMAQRLGQIEYEGGPPEYADIGPDYQFNIEYTQRPEASPEEFPDLETWKGQYNWYRKFISTPPESRPGGLRRAQLAPSVRWV